MDGEVQITLVCMGIFASFRMYIVSPSSSY
jgi:hypothetical protein